MHNARYIILNPDYDKERPFGPEERLQARLLFRTMVSTDRNCYNHVRTTHRMFCVNGISQTIAQGNQQDTSNVLDPLTKPEHDPKCHPQHQ